jgi:hypothetical protein
MARPIRALGNAGHGGNRRSSLRRAPIGHHCTLRPLPTSGLGALHQRAAGLGGKNRTVALSAALHREQHDCSVVHVTLEPPLTPCPQTQELPAPLVFLGIAALSGPSSFLQHPASVRTALAVAFVAHYSYRTFVYPFIIRGGACAGVGTASPYHPTQVAARLVRL